MTGRWVYCRGHGSNIVFDPPFDEVHVEEDPELFRRDGGSPWLATAEDVVDRLETITNKFKAAVFPSCWRIDEEAEEDDEGGETAL